MMPANYTYKMELEGNEGFILDTDLLDTGLLGYVPTDVTKYVRSVRTNAGRSTIQDRFTAGQMSVVFENRERVFDPNNTSSPFYGSIKPRRRIFFTIITSYYPDGFRVFGGTIDSWSFDYDVSTESTATVSASDAFTVLSNQNISLTNPAAETSDLRMNRVLDSATVAWPIENRSFIGAAFTLGTASYSGDALTYLQQIALSERGYLTVDGYNNVALLGWNWFVSPTVSASFGEAGSTAIPFTQIQMSYDTDQFYNYVNVTGYPGTVTTQSASSQAEFGISYGDFPVLQSGTVQMAYVANNINNKFSQPRFRVSQLVVSLDDASLPAISTEYGDAVSLLCVLASGIGSYVEVSYTPNNIGSPVVQGGFIIGVDISAGPGQCEITFSLSADDTRGAYP